MARLHIVGAEELCRSWGWAAPVAALALLLMLLALVARRHHGAGLAQDALRTQLLDRDRSARRLHDTLLQGMQGVILRLQAVNAQLPAGDPTQQGMDAALRRADEVLNEARERALALRRLPAPVSRLAGALHDAGSELAGDDGPEFLLQVSGAPRELAPAVHDEVRAIMNEALLNAFRHAQAHRIVLALRYGRHSFAAEVVDDGVGMTGEMLRHGQPGHWGLAGMRERAECVAATLVLRSRPGAGTSVRLKLSARSAYLRR